MKAHVIVTLCLLAAAVCVYFIAQHHLYWMIFPAAFFAGCTGWSFNELGELVPLHLPRISKLDLRRPHLAAANDLEPPADGKNLPLFTFPGGWWAGI